MSRDDGYLLYRITAAENIRLGVSSEKGCLVSQVGHTSVVRNSHTTAPISRGSRARIPHCRTCWKSIDRVEGSNQSNCHPSGTEYSSQKQKTCKSSTCTDQSKQMGIDGKETHGRLYSSQKVARWYR